MAPAVDGEPTVALSISSLLIPLVVVVAVPVASIRLFADEKPRLHDPASLRYRGIGDVENVDGRGLWHIRTAEAGNRIDLIAQDVPAPDSTGIAERRRKIARIDLLDGDLTILFGLVRITGTGIAQRVIDVVIAGGNRGPQVRVLEDADVGHQQRAIVWRQRDAIGIAPDADPANDRCKVVGFGDAPLRIDARLDLR